MSNRKGTGIIVTIAVVLLLSIVGIWHNASFREMGELRLEFADEMEIALSTSRMSLGSEIRELRDIHNQAKDLNVVPWASAAHDDLLLSMDLIIRGFLAFQSQDSDEAVSNYFERAERAINNYDNHRFTR